MSENRAIYVGCPDMFNLVNGRTPGRGQQMGAEEPVVVIDEDDSGPGGKRRRIAFGEGSSGSGRK